MNALTLTIFRATSVTRAISITLPSFTVVDNGYGGIIVRGPRGFYAQKSGHGHWCEIRLLGFEWWGDARTYRTIHFLRRKEGR